MPKQDTVAESELRPKLRPLQAQTMVADGQPVILLQDPLRLGSRGVFVHQALGPLLHFCDGTRTLEELRASLMIRAGLSLQLSQVADIVSQLDGALLLDNERSAAARRQVIEAFRSAPYRPPALAGVGYPADPEELSTLLDRYIQDLNTVPASSNAVRGLISPHIDYERGGSVYAQVWSRAAEAVSSAEVVVVLGTDHNGGPGRLTLTRQSYATPYGPLPTDQGVVDRVVAAIGEEAAFAEELDHRQEHSIELALTWLHHVRGREPCAMVPILTGSFHHFVEGTAPGPAGDPLIEAALEALSEALNGRSWLVVAAADLAHIGPAFDQPQPVDAIGKAALKVQDQALMETIHAGDAEGFFATLQAEGDRRNVCGLAPIYLTLRLLGETQGTAAGYDRCPADEKGTSFVSICGTLLT